MTGRRTARRPTGPTIAAALALLALLAAACSPTPARRPEASASAQTATTPPSPTTARPAPEAASDASVSSPAARALAARFARAYLSYLPTDDALAPRRRVRALVTGALLRATFTPASGQTAYLAERRRRDQSASARVLGVYRDGDGPAGTYRVLVRVTTRRGSRVVGARRVEVDVRVVVSRQGLRVAQVVGP